MVWTEEANIVVVVVVGLDTEERVDVVEDEVWGGEVTEEGDYPTAISIIQIIQQNTLRYSPCRPLSCFAVEKQHAYVHANW